MSSIVIHWYRLQKIGLKITLIHISKTQIIQRLSPYILLIQVIALLDILLDHRKAANSPKRKKGIPDIPIASSQHAGQMGRRQ